MRSFLGLCNYYRRFILGYSKITNPLNQLLHKNKPFKWTSECTTAFETFEKLKNALISPPILALPDTSKEFILSTDASSTAIGFVLSQADSEGRERAIAYGGRSLRGAEFKWDVSKRECLALVEGIKQFHPYLASNHFIVYTDHIALKWLQSIKESSKTSTVVNEVTGL